MWTRRVTLILAKIIVDVFFKYQKVVIFFFSSPYYCLKFSGQHLSHIHLKYSICSVDQNEIIKGGTPFHLSMQKLNRDKKVSFKA